MNAPLSPSDEQKVLSVLSTDGKIAAIKLYRELGQSSLRDAKRGVEALAGAAAQETVDFGNDLDPDVMDEILDSIDKGKKLNAVKSYMAATGVSLIESKEFIERLMAELDLEDAASTGGGCAGTVLVFLAIASLAGGLLLA